MKLSTPPLSGAAFLHCDDYSGARVVDVEISRELHTADFLIASLGETIPASALPAAIFVLAAFTAFSTGGSWGAMGILLPLVLPLLGDHGSQGLTGGDYAVLYASVSGVWRRVGRPLSPIRYHHDVIIGRLRPHRACPHPAALRRSGRCCNATVWDHTDQSGAPGGWACCWQRL